MLHDLLFQMQDPGTGEWLPPPPPPTVAIFFWQPLGGWSYGTSGAMLLLLVIFGLIGR